MAIDEMFDAAAYVRARCEGGDVDELAAFALCCKADATRLGNMVGRIQRKLDAVIETRDAARKAFDEVLQQRQDALAELKSAREMADAMAAAHAEASRLRDETIETLQREIAALQRREAYVQQERECAAANAAMWYEQKEEAIDKLRVAFEERDAAVAERNKLRDIISLAYGERDSAITARNEAITKAEMASRERDRAAKAHAEASGVVDRLGCRIVDLEADVLCLQGERDRARAEIEEMRVELNSRVNEVNEARRLVRDLAEMTVSRDQLRDEAAMLRQRPTYEARQTPPTPEELAAHEAVGGLWLILTVGQRYHVMQVTTRTLAMDVVPQTWIALDARGLPCAWPVVSLVKP